MLCALQGLRAAPAATNTAVHAAATQRDLQSPGSSSSSSSEGSAVAPGEERQEQQQQEADEEEAAEEGYSSGFGSDDDLPLPLGSADTSGPMPAAIVAAAGAAQADAPAAALLPDSPGEVAGPATGLTLRRPAVRQPPVLPPLKGLGSLSCSVEGLEEQGGYECGELWCVARWCTLGALPWGQ